MMAAYRLRGLGWLASCAGIVLGFYLVSLQVASERNRLEALNGRIRAAERDIRALETEFDTRANLQQLEKWNGDILALSAPVARQFVRSGGELAQVSFAPIPLGDGEVKTAALVVPALSEPPVAPMPAVAPAAAPAVAAVRVAVASAPARVTPPIASAPAKPSPAARMAQAARTAVASVKPQKVAMLDGGLLSDGTFGDLLSGARAETTRR